MISVMVNATQIEKGQRNFPRRLPGFGDFSYGERLEKVGLEFVEARRIRFDLVEAYKILNWCINI